MSLKVRLELVETIINGESTKLHGARFFVGDRHAWWIDDPCLALALNCHMQKKAARVKPLNEWTANWLDLLDSICQSLSIRPEKSPQVTDFILANVNESLEEVPDDQVLILASRNFFIHLQDTLRFLPRKKRVMAESLPHIRFSDLKEAVLKCANTRMFYPPVEISVINFLAKVLHEPAKMCTILERKTTDKVGDDVSSSEAMPILASV